jgi:hypothetical protein
MSSAIQTQTIQPCTTVFIGGIQVLNSTSLALEVFLLEGTDQSTKILYAKGPYNQADCKVQVNRVYTINSNPIPLLNWIFQSAITVRLAELS